MASYAIDANAAVQPWDSVTFESLVRTHVVTQRGKDWLMDDQWKMSLDYQWNTPSIQQTFDDMRLADVAALARLRRRLEGEQVRARSASKRIWDKQVPLNRGAHFPVRAVWRAIGP
jgi:hypothetical protein